MAEIEAETDPEELKRQGLELNLMQTSYKVRDHAKESGDWTDHHTEAIEAIGNALLLDLGWDEEAVEQHMKSVVESIDGLEFVSQSRSGEDRGCVKRRTRMRKGPFRDPSLNPPNQPLAPFHYTRLAFILEPGS